MITKSHTLSVGIVGLPNAGKSTIFNALTKKSVPAENFPFCTIDKNIGVIEIPDQRLDKLANFFNAKKKVPSAMTFVDIAGLVKGASKGEGLGNQFLSHIREVDVIMYVLRAFPSGQIVHVYDRVNPVEDFEIVQSELILKDIESVEKKLASVEKLARAGQEKAQEEKEALDKVLENLNSGIPVIDISLTEGEKELISELWLLTSKHRMFVLNCREGVAEEDLEKWEEQLKEFVGGDKDYILRVDVKLIGEMDDKQEYAELLGYEPNSVEDVIKVTYKRLDLITFYTGSEKECNSWTIQRGANIKEAAGVIHTDLEKGFVTADVVNVEEMIEAGGWVAAKEKGIVKNHGKDYTVKDGDYIVILANK
ncbi:MAG: GTP-binding protein YchF [candidate division WS6 bacterium 34_10]|uniref:GTP-binding protein YchF n=1 Tax=candidate division WS6 bacterium 34_10 TaxID=1641389 RepID=A0A101HJC5_9BACT|nr:MAG: GTP-binding protein YchF [candidate division WS6 bacterium 34_10]